MQMLSYLSAYFTTLMNSKNFKNGIMGLYTTQAKYLYNKLRINFSMSPSLQRNPYLKNYSTKLDIIITRREFVRLSS